MDFLEWLSLVSDVYAHAIITGIVREVYFHSGPSFWSIMEVVLLKRRATVYRIIIAA